MSKRFKILILCAAVFVVGIIMTAAGYAGGGVSGYEKIAADHDWISFGPVDKAIIEEDHEFDAIEATGNADLQLVGSEYFNRVLEDQDLEGIEAKAGKVIVIYDKSRHAPEVTTKGKQLIINAGSRDNVPIDFSSDLNSPEVIVLCGDKELSSIRVSGQACDLDLLGIRFAKADIGLNAGDIEAEGITSKGLKIENDAGDVEIAGVLKGKTTISLEAGDIELDPAGVNGEPDPAGGLEKYSMKLHAPAGDIRVGKNEIEGAEYTQKGGKDLLKLTTLAGDIKVTRR